MKKIAIFIIFRNIDYKLFCVHNCIKNKCITIHKITYNVWSNNWYSVFVFLVRWWNVCFSNKPRKTNDSKNDGLITYFLYFWPLYTIDTFQKKILDHICMQDRPFWVSVFAGVIGNVNIHVHKRDSGIYHRIFPFDLRSSINKMMLLYLQH